MLAQVRSIPSASAISFCGQVLPLAALPSSPLEAFKRLKLIESAQSWWWGDLANAREKHYGSLKEVAERLEIEYKSLQNYQWVSSQYKLSTRVDSLSFRHHQIAAPLEDRLEWAMGKVGPHNY